MVDERRQPSSTPTFADLLRRHRIAAALSQEALAERAGLSARTISDLERGVKKRPYLETVRMLADALNLPLPERTELARVAHHQESPYRGEHRESTTPGLRGVIPLVSQTSLVGRDLDVAQVMQLLRRTDQRLVTLIGPGGVGKTRLALAVAKAVQSESPDGVWFIDLTTVVDPALVPSAIVQALELSEAGGTPLLDQIVAFLHGKQILLVLDNFEHVIGAAPLIANLIGRQSSAKVLVTSRMPLHVSGEQEVPVDPLALPEQRLELPDELRDNPAITLFINRAQAVRPGFTLTDENASAIFAICHRLDGLPLAIELAAARTKLMSPQSLLERLAHALPILTRGPIDRPDRHQAMHATIAWSYNLLDESERALFRRISAFKGGCTFETAEAVCNFDGTLDILGGIASLVDKSLLRCDGDEPRIRMLETVREFGSDRLNHHPDVLGTRQALTSWASSFVESAQAQLLTSNQLRWLRRTDTELPNLLYALDLLVAESDAEASQRLASGLWYFWQIRSRLSEARSYLEQALSLAGESLPTRCRALEGLANIVFKQDDEARSEKISSEQLYFARECGDHLGAAEALLGLARSAAIQGDPDRALECARDAGEYAAALNNHHLAMRIALMQGQVDMRRGEFASADAVFSSLLPQCRSIGDQWLVARVLMVTGYVALMRGQLDRALVLLNEFHELAVLLADTRGIADAHFHLANVAAAAGDVESAKSYCEEGLALAQQIGAPSLEGDILGVAVDLARAGGHCFEAAALAERRLAIFSRLGTPPPYVYYERVDLAIECQDILAVNRLFLEAFAEIAAVKDESTIAYGLFVAARFADRSNEPELAVRLLAASAEMQQRLDYHLSPRLIEIQKAIIDRLRVGLGEEQFALQWKQGRSASWHESMPRALAIAI